MVFTRSLCRQLGRPLLSRPFAAQPFARAAPWTAFSGVRTLTATANHQVKVLLVLYDVSEPL